jgi:hypothetical protein
MNFLVTNPLKVECLKSYSGWISAERQALLFCCISRSLETTEKVLNAAKMFPLWRDEESRNLRDEEAIPHIAGLPRPDGLAMTKKRGFSVVSNFWDADLGLSRNLENAEKL